MEGTSKGYIKRFILMIVAIIILALGVALLRFSNFGTDPFNCMNLGVSMHIPIGYATYQMLLNIVLFIPLFILKPKILGPGAIVNMFFLGYIVEAFCYIFNKCGITIDNVSGNMPVRVGFLIGGILCLCFGVALYMECNMGTAAYDALGQVVDERSLGKLKFKWVRVTTDLICIAIGYVAGSVVGIGTVISAFFTGPFVSGFRNLIAKLNILDTTRNTSE